MKRVELRSGWGNARDFHRSNPPGLDEAEREGEKGLWRKMWRSRVGITK